MEPKSEVLSQLSGILRRQRARPPDTAMASYSMGIDSAGKLDAVSHKHSADNHRATSQKPDNNFTVDLDVEKNRISKDDSNKHRVVIKFSKKIRLEMVRAYLEGKIDFDNAVLEGISKTLSIFVLRMQR